MQDKTFTWAQSPYSPQERYLQKADAERQAIAMASEALRTRTRGGARPGSGRKPATEKKITISFRVTRETHDRIQALRKEGIDITGELDRMVRELEDIIQFGE